MWDKKGSLKMNCQAYEGYWQSAMFCKIGISEIKKKAYVD